MPLPNLRRSLPDLPVYLAVSLAFGLCMNSLGYLLCIAHFKHWWQVATCYWGWVMPVALLVRHRPGWDQVAWGVTAMVPLELVGFALGTSLPCPGNVLEAALGPLNFSLAMVAIGGSIPRLINAIVGTLRPAPAG